MYSVYDLVVYLSDLIGHVGRHNDGFGSAYERYSVGHRYSKEVFY